MINIFCNDHIFHTVSKQKELLGTAKGPTCVSISDLNEYIAFGLTGMLLPIHSVNKEVDSKLSIGDMKPFSGWDVMAKVAPIPAFKFVHTSSSKLVSAVENSKRLESMASWDDVSSNLYRNMLLDIPGYKPSPLFSRLYSRGVQSLNFYDKIPSISKKISSRWGSSCMGQSLEIINSFVQGIDTRSQKKSLTLVTNSDLASVTLDNIIENVQSKLEVRAYLHWYSRYIPDIQDEMYEALEALKNVSQDYKDITKV